MNQTRRRRTLLASSLGFSKAQMQLGLSVGRALIELKNCDPISHAAIEEILAEGKAVASEWTEHPITHEIYRTITRRPLRPSEIVRKD